MSVHASVHPSQFLILSLRVVYHDVSLGFKSFKGYAALKHVVYCSLFNFTHLILIKEESSLVRKVNFYH